VRLRACEALRALLNGFRVAVCVCGYCSGYLPLCVDHAPRRGGCIAYYQSSTPKTPPRRPSVPLLRRCSSATAKKKN